MCVSVFLPASARAALAPGGQESPSSLTDPQSQPSSSCDGCSGPGRRRPADPLSPCSEPTSRQTCDHACPDSPATALLLSAAVWADRALKPAECFCVKAGSALQYASAYTGINMHQHIVRLAPDTASYPAGLSLGRQLLRTQRIPFLCPVLRANPNLRACFFNTH